MQTSTATIGGVQIAYRKPLRGMFFYPKLWTMNNELQTMNYEQFTMNYEQWTMNNELWTIKLFKTKPISKMPKMVVTAVYTMTNNNEQRTMNCSKQTQSNPTRSELVEPISNSKRSGDPYGWASLNPQTGSQYFKNGVSRVSKVEGKRFKIYNRSLWKSIHWIKSVLLWQGTKFGRLTDGR